MPHTKLNPPITLIAVVAVEAATESVTVHIGGNPGPWETNACPDSPENLYLWKLKVTVVSPVLVWFGAIPNSYQRCYC